MPVLLVCCLPPPLQSRYPLARFALLHFSVECHITNNQVALFLLCQDSGPWNTCLFIVCTDWTALCSSAKACLPRSLLSWDTSTAQPCSECHHPNTTSNTPRPSLIFFHHKGNGYKSECWHSVLWMTNMYLAVKKKQKRVDCKMSSWVGSKTCLYHTLWCSLVSSNNALAFFFFHLIIMI